MSFLTNSNVTQQAYLNSLHLASQNYVIKTVATADTLSNTNIGVEADRAQGAENSIEQQLTTYIASSTTSNAGLSTAIAALQTRATTNENSASSEVSRAEAAESANRTLITSGQTALTAENSRALAAEAVLTSGVSANGAAIQAIQVVDAIQTSNISSNSTAITSLQSSRTTDETNIASNLTAINSLQASRTTDESNISSLMSSRTADESNIASNTTSISLLQASRTTDEAHIASNTSSITALGATQVTDEARITAEVNRASAAEASTNAAVSANTTSINTLVASKSTDEAHLTSLQASMDALGTAVNTSTASVSGVLIAGQINTNTVSCAGPMLLTSSGDQWGKVVLHIDNTSASNGVKVDTTGSTADVADLVLLRNTGDLIMRYENATVDSNNTSGGEYKLLNITAGTNASANGLTLYSGLKSSGIYQGDFNVKSGSVTASTSVNAPLIESDVGTLTMTSKNAQYGTSIMTLTNAPGSNGLTIDQSQGLVNSSGIVTLTMKAVNGQVQQVYEDRSGSLIDSANAADGEYKIVGGHGPNFYTGTASSGVLQGNFVVPHGSITAATSVTASSFVASSLSCVGPLTLTSTGDAYGQVALKINNTSGSNGIMVDTSGSSVNAADLVLKNNTGNVILRFENDVIDSNNQAGGEFKMWNQTTGNGAVNGGVTLYSGVASSGVLQGNFNVAAGNVTVPAGNVTVSGIVSDSRDVDVTMMSYWSNSFNNSPAEIRLVRKGSIVTVVMQNFSATPINSTGIAQYNLSVPAQFIPTNGPVQCTIVLTTNGNPAVGCATMTSTGLFQIFPFSGTWGSGTAGINQPTSFSYLL